MTGDPKVYWEKSVDTESQRLRIAEGQHDNQGESGGLAKDRVRKKELKPGKPAIQITKSSTHNPKIQHSENRARSSVRASLTVPVPIGLNKLSKFPA